MSELGKSLDQFNRIKRKKEFLKKIPETPIGIKTPLERGNVKKETLFKMHFDIIDQIEDNLKNLIMTQKGERLGFPDFGTNLRQIYSNNTLSEQEIVDLASEEIRLSVQKYMPSLELQEFYSKQLSVENLKENAVIQNANKFAENLSVDITEENSINEINKLNQYADSLFEITINYFIPLLNKKKSINLTINSSK